MHAHSQTIESRANSIYRQPRVSYMEYSDLPHCEILPWCSTNLIDEGCCWRIVCQVMATTVAPLVRVFSSRYGGAINWFPGHMHKTTTHLAMKVKQADVVVEVRDARVPWSSANPLLDNLCQSAGRPKPRIVIFNKTDLANEQLQSTVKRQIESQGNTAIFTSATYGIKVGKLLSIIDSYPSKAARFTSVGSTVLIVGVPNTGKSSIINALRKLSGGILGNGAKAGAAPGITRSVGTIQIRHNPPVYVFDSPGVMPPRIDNVEIGLRLALVNAIPEARVPFSVLAEYLLFLFHSIGTGKFAQNFDLSKAFTEDEVELMLTEIANRFHLKTAGGQLDTEGAARAFVRSFQVGDMGKYTLDPIHGSELNDVMR
jgi:ribosome biogenesis GTPase A